ncbi:MAG TPA: hypothetical protein VG388_05595 [Solirubrobacteraceae bacterium]|nr:hypothetical protein [Solirubrobacteraceae bacterium]
MRLWILLGLAVALAAVFALLSLGFLVEATTTSRVHSTSSRVGDAVGAAVCLALVVVLSRASIHLEHRLRASHPAAQALAASEMPSGTARWTSLFGWKRRGRYSPVGGAVSLVVFIAATIGFAVGAVSDHAQAVRSSYVQHHGTPATGTVDTFTNTRHCSRSGCSYTAAVTVTLRGSVAGTVLTVAHYPRFANVFPGEPVNVLVDPRERAYAEFPGAPFKRSFSWIMLVVFAVLFAALAVADGLALRRLLAHGREYRAPVTEPGV